MKGKDKIGKRIAKKEQSFNEKSKQLLAESLRQKENRISEESPETDEPRPALSRFTKK